MRPGLSLFAVFALCSLPQAAIAADWIPVRETSLEMREGSPLDFSGLMPNPVIDEHQRLVVNVDGRIAYAGTPDQPQRLLCASLGFTPVSGGYPSHAETDAYVRQLVLHGYNIARLHFTDASLIEGRDGDFDFDPGVLDRIHYLMAALKKNGIHWIVDGLSSWRGGYGGHEDRWAPADGLKLEINYEDGAFAHWQALVGKFLGTVNPYTGVAPIRDDALALIVLVNENGMEYSATVTEKPGLPYPESLRSPFNAWLSSRYGSSEAMRSAGWDLAPNEQLENHTIRLPADRHANSARMRDLQGFFVATERNSASRMTTYIRDLGYPGLVSNFNNGKTVQASLGRQDLQVVTMNSYHDWVTSLSPGTRLDGRSSLGDAAAYMREAAAARWLAKPFAITEYDHLFWNSHRYEAGLVMPAYAAFQGWDLLCRHASGPVILKYGEDFQNKRAMLPYQIALDPVARAGETLSALLFRRGDVSMARGTVPFLVRGLEDLDGDMQATELNALTQLSLVSSVGLSPAETQSLEIAVTQPRHPLQFGEILAALKTAGVVATSNRTDPFKGLFESDTGELLLNRREQTLLVSTPRTQALAFAQIGRPVDLGDVTIEASDGPGLFAAAALDGAARLRDSKRILLIYATDARNSGMRFQDAEEKIIDDFGTLPVLIKKGRIEVSFNGRAARWRLSPVGLDGSARPILRMLNGRINLALSNDTPTGPTTFFLLETD